MLTPTDFEHQAQALIGHSVVQVYYYELGYLDETGQNIANWHWHPQLDSLDYGLDLVTATGDVFFLTWDWAFGPYGVSIQPNLTGPRDGGCRWDVSNTSRWQTLLGQKITQVRVLWERVEDKTTGANPEDYPQNLEISFTSGRQVYISAFEIRPDGFQMGMMDHITVFFDQATAKTFQIGLLE